MTIKLNRNIQIDKVQDCYSEQCFYCRKKIRKKTFCLVIHSSSGYDKVWLHFNCIEKFAEDIVKFKYENLKGVMVDSL